MSENRRALHHAVYVPFYDPSELIDKKTTEKEEEPPQESEEEKPTSTHEELQPPFDAIEPLGPAINYLSRQQRSALLVRLVKENPEIAFRQFEKTSVSEIIEKIRVLSPSELNTHLIDYATSGPIAEAPLPNIPQVENSQLGFIFYEKLTFNPVGTEPSEEVLKTIHLAPNGETELTKRTWSKVQTEFSEALSQLREEELQSSESQTKEISESAAKQSQFSVNNASSIQISGEDHSTGTKITARSSFTLNNARTHAHNLATKDLRELTTKAAARTKREHKVTYTTRTEISTEYSTTERIKNPNTTHAVKITLHKLLKKWLIRHEQYDLRLCADIMVKNPGKNLRKTLHLEEFDPTSVTPPDPELKATWPEGVPEIQFERREMRTLKFPAGKHHFAVMFVNPDGFELDYARAWGEKGDVTWSVNGTILGTILADEMGLKDAAHPRWRGNYVDNFNAWAPTEADKNATRVDTVNIEAVYKIKEAFIDKWIEVARQMKIVEERQKWEFQRQERIAKEKAIDEESTVPPAQMLRKEERDELLSAVARYLLELDGHDMPEPISPGEEASLYHAIPPTIIRKIHEAFEWESMSSFLLPYWWDPKVFVDDVNIQGGLKEIFQVNHPNFLRREFCRSSWARVLVPVRPGHEKWILGLMYPGFLEALEANDTDAESPIGELVQAYNDIVTSQEPDSGEFGPRTDDENEGQKIAPEPKILSEWIEYTPMDETTAKMEILSDEAGVKVDVAEPYLRMKQDEELAQERALTEIKKTISDKLKTEIDRAKIRIITSEGDTIEFEPE